MRKMYSSRNKTTKPIKAVLHHTRSNEMISSELYKIMQRAFLKNEDYFQIDRSQYHWDPLKSEEVKRELVKKLQLDKVPQAFKDNFELDYSSPDVKNQIVDVFADAVSLNTEKWSKSDRVVFSRDKIMIFRNESPLVHKDEWKHTQAEKKLKEIETTFLTFSNIYDAIRSQYHAIDTMKIDQDTCLSIIQDVQQLAAEIKESTQFSKDEQFKRKLNDIIQELWKVRDYKKLWAVLNNLKQLSFTNKSIASNQLLWAFNKFKSRFKDISTMLEIIAYRDIPKLERILQIHEEALKMLLAQIKIPGVNRDYVLSEYHQKISTAHEEYLNVAPFSIFYDRMIKYKDDKEILPKCIQKIESLYEVYKQEHETKKNGDTEEFDYFEIVKDNLKEIEKFIVTETN